jgi:hypothetical protein
MLRFVSITLAGLVNNKLGLIKDQLFYYKDT